MLFHAAVLKFTCKTLTFAFPSPPPAHIYHHDKHHHIGLHLPWQCIFHGNSSHWYPRRPLSRRRGHLSNRAHTPELMMPVVMVSIQKVYRPFCMKPSVNLLHWEMKELAHPSKVMEGRILLGVSAPHCVRVKLKILLRSRRAKLSVDIHPTPG